MKSHKDDQIENIYSDNHNQEIPTQEKIVLIQLGLTILALTLSVFLFK